MIPAATSRSIRRTLEWLPTVVLVLLAVAIVVSIAGDAGACPTCKDGVAESDPEGTNVARGYFYSILIMLAMPFTLAGTFGAYVWREMRRQERDRVVHGIPPAPLPPPSVSEERAAGLAKGT
jgi:integral membrane sensor domain MASE1